MEVIWGQIVTQIIGFILAVLILKRYAWGPILGLLEERRRRIQAEFDDIERRRREVEGLRVDYEAKLRDIDQEARERIKEAMGEAAAAATRIREKAQEERRERLQRAQEEIVHLEESASAALKQEMVTLALRATEKLLEERLDEARHKELIRRFIDQAAALGKQREAGAAS